MFKESIQTTPLTTEAANSYFSDKIYGSNFAGDSSLTATLRALIAPRMPDNASLSVEFGNIQRYSVDALTSDGPEEVVRRANAGYDLSEGDSMFVLNVNNSTDEANAMEFEILADNFTKLNNGFRQIEEVARLFQKSFRVLCFVNDERRITVLYINRVNLRKLHYIQCATLGFFPWYFNPKDGITELESALIYSFREDTADKYLECITKIAEQYDFETARVKRLLNEFETQWERQEITRCETDISTYIEDINRLNESIGDLNRRMGERNIYLLGLRQKIATGEGGSEIGDYFACNKHLYLEDVRGSEIFFVVKDYLTYFDEDMVQSCIDNPYSFVYDNRPNRCKITEDQMKRLMRACFIDQTIKIRMCAAYSFDMRGNVRTHSGHDFGDIGRTYIPNPHINRYNCMGNYTNTINRLLAKRDYLGAFEQTIASAKSLNWGDSAVMNEFFRTLYGTSDYHSSNNGFELPDGTVVDVAGAIKWLEEN